MDVLVAPVNKPLLAAGVLSLLAALMHVCIVFGGPAWYRFFGAGEGMAQMAARGDMYPVLLTLAIGALLAVWGLYALSGAGLLTELPLLRFGLVAITAVYCVRGVCGMLLPLVADNPYVAAQGLSFWLWSSAICLVLGGLHLVGLWQVWARLS
jgi:putative oxidoreductase